jgi:SAM-dependent methyltransferase
MPLPGKLKNLPHKLSRLRAAVNAAVAPGRPHFYLESPRGGRNERIATSSPTVVSGWVAPPSGRPVLDVEVLVDDELVARAPLQRISIGNRGAFLGLGPANRRRFSTEVYLDRWTNRGAEMTLRADFGEGPHILAHVPLQIEGRIGEQARRARSFHLCDLLACPACGAWDLDLEPERVQCCGCGDSFETRRGTPLFASPNNPVTSRLLESSFTHPYSDDSLELISQHPNGVVLDYGAGHPSRDSLYPNVLLHEVVQYNQIDVVSVWARLPYRDNSFDAVISQAVFEHVPRPWEAASELYRVLKPGGQIHIDTAFMQPYHSDPFHFFNMTLPGIREVFRPFRELRSGVKPYQMPSFGLRMQLGVMLAQMAPGGWRDRMTDLLDSLNQDGAGFDASLDPEGRNRLAAGFYFHGVK